MATTFHSTRSTTDSLTAKQAIRKGIADDGGLFVSDALGETKVDVASLPGKTYQQIAAEVLGTLLPDFTAEELGQCIADAYGEQWSDERITPLKPLGDDYVLELFNGPTSAFKDVALQILPRFMAHTTPADGDADEKIMILTATSGDTGKAALAGFADAPGTAITVFYPEGKVSQVQELQMTTQAGSNVQVAAVEGNFDDAQSAVKRIFGDRALAERLAGNAHVVLSSANSINVGRLVPQVVYYFSAYAQLLADQVINVGDEVEFVVPTGNFGDILAVLLSTASPYKFPRVVNEALGFDATGTDFECMDVLARETGTTAPAALRGLETADVRFKDVVAIDGMEDYVEKAAQSL